MRFPWYWCRFPEINQRDARRVPSWQVGGAIAIMFSYNVENLNKNHSLQPVGRVFHP
jgi:hypothetical protein